MLDLPRDHPAFDEALEVLCLLSTHEKPLASVTHDMGFQRGMKTKSLLNRLRDRGFAVRCDHRLVGPNEVATAFVWIDQDGWLHAEAAAEAYWQQTRGE